MAGCVPIEDCELSTGRSWDCTDGIEPVGATGAIAVIGCWKPVGGEFQPPPPPLTLAGGTNWPSATRLDAPKLDGMGWLREAGED
jgi:hypothetical protein